MFSTTLTQPCRQSRAVQFPDIRSDYARVPHESNLLVIKIRVVNERTRSRLEE